MNKGVLLFAHNSKEVDYSLLAIIAGGLAKKNLSVPVSLVTDSDSVKLIEKNNLIDKARLVFDQIIIVDNEICENTRILKDGASKTIVPFINSNRSSAWDLTPYDKTLLIDVDYLIMSPALNAYWDIDEDFLISKAFNDIFSENRTSYLDRYVSNIGVHLYWATTIMFTKNENSKLMFDLVKKIKDNYRVFSNVYQFNSKQYRNDISFSIAKHILDGYETNLTNTLPAVLTVQDRDLLIDVKENNLLFLIDKNHNKEYVACSLKNTDIHVMNKKSIIRNAEKLLGMI